MLEGENILLERISEGDESAFRDLFGYYYPKVLTFLGHYIPDDEDRRDIAQTIFARIWTKRDILSDIRSFGAYIYRLSRNSAIDYCRRQKIRIPLSDKHDTPFSHAADDEYFARESRLQYHNCLKSMPERRRKVFMLSREDGLSNDEIARQLGISKKTVENHLNAALRELRKIVSSIALFF